MAEQPSPISAEATLAAGAIRVPPGYTITPVASEPQLANPVAFCFDPAGRIFVAETHRVYKGVEDNRGHMDWLDDDLAARTVAERREFMVRRMGEHISQYASHSDLVRLLEDRDADGVYEHSSVFSTGYKNVEDGAAAGVLWVDGRLLFTCIPSLWELRDADGDGAAEHKRALASGFGVHVAFFGHDMHGLTHGPDGKIYFSIGDRGLQVTTAEGRELSNPDSGAVLRCNPDGSELELFATGLRNPQELAFNEYGDLFTVDNNSDSGDRARLVHVVEGMDAGWRMSYQYLPDRGPFNRENIWRPQNPQQPASIVPPVANITDGPSGLVHYPGTGLPSEHAGAFFVCDFRGSAGTSGVRQFWVEPSGAGYRLARERMFAEGVLATDCDFGPDGALYISDWIEGWSGTGSGRIHRLASNDAQSTAARDATRKDLARLEELDAAELLSLLGHADARVRREAHRRLVSAGTKSAALLLPIAASAESNPLARRHAIWALGELAEQDGKLFREVAAFCKDADPEIRAQAAKTLGRGAEADEPSRRPWGDALIPLLADASPRVRTFAAISIGKLQHRDALSALLKAAEENAIRDPVLRHALAMGLAGSQPPDALAAAAANAGEAARLAAVVALGRQKSPLVAQFLDDQSSPVKLEAARAIWDRPIAKAFGPLAEQLRDVPPENDPLLRRSLAASVAMRTPAHLEAVIKYGLRPDLSRPMREHLWQLIRDWAAPPAPDPVHGLWRPLQPRPAAEVAATVKSAMPWMVAAGPHGDLGLVVAAELGIAEAYDPVAAIVSSEAQPAATRIRGLAAIKSAHENILAPAINAAVKSQDAAVRSSAREVMAERFPERAVELLLAAAETGATLERQAALAMLARLKAPAAQSAIERWFARLERGDCPPELQLEVLEAAAQSGAPELVARHAKYVEQLAKGDPLAPYSASLHGGDAEQGRRIFEESAALACRRCHSVTPGEKLVGPNLADVGLRLPRLELLQSIVKPNEKITEGFQTTVLQLDTGKVVSGILRSEDAKHAVLVDAEGKELVVDAATIEDRFEGLSAMPEDLMKQMTPRDLRHLVEYLSQQRTATETGAARAVSGEPSAGHAPGGE